MNFSRLEYYLNPPSDVSDIDKMLGIDSALCDLNEELAGMIEACSDADHYDSDLLDGVNKLFLILRGRLK